MDVYTRTQKKLIDTHTNTQVYIHMIRHIKRNTRAEVFPTLNLKTNILKYVYTVRQRKVQPITHIETQRNINN